VSRVVATADGKSLIVLNQGKYCIIQPAPGQKIENLIPTDVLEMELIPKEEWKQIFMDTWHRHRDFFYDPNMQGVDWEEVLKLTKENKHLMTSTPPLEDRTAKGLRDSD